MMTTYGAISDKKVGTMTTLSCVNWYQQIYTREYAPWLFSTMNSKLWSLLSWTMNLIFIMCYWFCHNCSWWNICWVINSLAPGRCGSNFKSMIFTLIIQGSSLGIHLEIDLKWMPKNLTIEESTLFQVMTWCRQATSHFLSQCWPRSVLPYDITRSQWVWHIYHTIVLSKYHIRGIVSGRISCFWFLVGPYVCVRIVVSISGWFSVTW